MAGQYDYPSNYYSWFIEGDDLIIVTNYPTDDNNSREWISPQETITDGLLIHYLAEPDEVTAITDTLDLENSLHKFVVEYVKAEMYMAEAGKAVMKGDENGAVMMERMALRHEKKWKDEIDKYGMQKKDKIGGRRRFMPLDYRTAL